MFNGTVSKKRIRILNLISGLLCQVLVAVSGLIIPNLILNNYGSVLNGLLATVTQILAYLSLVEMGLFSAALVSLYKPMAKKDYTLASSIFASIHKFYCKIAVFFALGCIACSCVVPQLIKDDIPLTTIYLVLLSMAGINIFNYLVFAKYKVVLQADDRIYVINFTHCVGVIIQFILSLLVIDNDINIAGVKAVIIIANVIEWIFLFLYVKKHIPQITLNAKSRDDKIHQRKDLLIHQVLALVLNNTDVVLLTLFMPSLAYVSVYSVYAMILLLVQNIANIISGMYSSQVGQLYALRDYSLLYKIMHKYEFVFYTTLFSTFSMMDVLIMPFISIYTKNVDDAVYYIPIIGLLFSVYGIFRMYRAPFSELTNAAGKFKETKIQALNEVGINLLISIALISNYGIIGVLLGSLAGEIYRTVHTIVYCHKSIIPIQWWRNLCAGILNSVLFFVAHMLMYDFRIYQPLSYFVFFLMAIKICMIVFLVYSALNYIIYRFMLNSHIEK